MIRGMIIKRRYPNTTTVSQGKMLMERGHNDQQDKQRFAFLKEKTVSVLLEPNMIRGYAYGFMCNPVWN